MTETEKAIRYVQQRTEWHLKDTRILNESRWEWIAEATTTHLTAHGEPEISFIVIGNGQNHVTLQIGTLANLLEWIQERRMS